MSEPAIDPNPDYPTHMYVNPADYFRGSSEKTSITVPLYYGGCFFFGFTLACLMNYGNKKPMMSGIQKHIILTSLSLLAGDYAFKWRERRAIEKDAILRHYIETHPEDFPPIERQKFKDIFKKWYPVR